RPWLGQGWPPPRSSRAGYSPANARSLLFGKLAQVRVITGTAVLSVGAERIQHERMGARRLGRILVGIAPRVVRQTILQIRPLPALCQLAVARLLHQQLQTFLLGRVPADVKTHGFQR